MKRAQLQIVLYVLTCVITVVISVLPPVAHADTDADADAYFAAIVANGGAMSSSDQSAITTFVTSAKVHGYWNNLIDVGPLAGDDLNAALVKLKYSSASSTSLLENHNFVESDYSRTNGLQGGTNTAKWLNTKTNLSKFTSGFGGLSFWIGKGEVATGTQVLMGVANNGTPFLTFLAAGAGYWGGNPDYSSYSLTIDKAGIPDGFQQLEKSTLSSLREINNGIVTQTNSTPTIASSRDADISVFAQTGQEDISYLKTNGYFYSIDDGSMTDGELADFYQDVKQLETNLGRFVPKSTPLKYSMIIGQSLATGSDGSPALSTAQQYENKMFYGGMLSPDPVFQGSLTPLVESGQETIASGMTDFVSKFTRDQHPDDSSQDLAVSNWGVGGWGYVYLKKGSFTGTYTNSIASVMNANTLAHDFYGTSLVVPGDIAVHGETDADSDTYQSDIEQWQSDYETDIKAITGQRESVPMFHTQISSWTYTGGGDGTAKSPYAVLAAYEVNPTKTILVGPKYFLPYGPSGVHLTNAGYRELGEYYGKAWNKSVVDGGVWSPLRPISQTIFDKSIYVQFTGNVGDLALDTTLVSNPGNYGFEYTDDSSSASISSVSLVGTSTVRVTLNTVPTGSNMRIRYAYTGIPGNPGGPMTGPRGNLRDSDPTLSLFDDDGDGQLDDHLYNWAVHFDKPISPDVAPSISNVTVSNVSSNGVVVSWITDAEATSQAAYGADTAYGTASTSAELVTSHTISLTGLSASTLYHFQVASADASGNMATSSDQTFTTAATSGGCSTIYVTEGNTVYSITCGVKSFYSTVPSSDGGYSGGSTSAVTYPSLGTTTVSTIVSTPGVVPSSLCPVGFICTPMAQAVASSLPALSTYKFTRDLFLGSIGEDIAQLQEYLNFKGFTVSIVGAGSLNHETSFFGIKTQSALERFQRAHSITPSIGYFGPITRAFINTH